MNLSDRSDQELLTGILKLVGSYRELTAQLVAYLVEIEDRRLHLLAGYPSMFEFCLVELRFSEGEAFRRILAARLAKRFPVVHSLLASGTVHLSALALLRDHLTDENHAELLDAASGKSTREVDAFLASRFPRPDVPARVQQLSEARFKVQFTASAELCEKLELCRDLMSHSNPTRDLGTVVERATDLLLADLRKKRLGATKRPRRERGGRPVTPDRVTNATRRKVYERDGAQCTFVSPDGRRCTARAFLELDHAQPKALGGSDSNENLRVRCRAHNQLWAEQAFGRGHVERSRHFRHRKWKHPREKGQHGTGEKRSLEPSPSAALEKVRLALKGMGFRDAQARRALAEVERMHAGTGPPAIEQALREALLVATTG